MRVPAPACPLDDSPGSPQPSFLVAIVALVSGAKEESGHQTIYKKEKSLVPRPKAPETCGWVGVNFLLILNGSPGPSPWDMGKPGKDQGAGL